MKKVILDCDPGHDDAIAMLLATRADNIDLIGVTTVAGNSELHHTVNNALRVLNYADVYDIPVYAGCSKPMMRDLYRLTGAVIHGEDGLGGPEIPAPTQKPEEKHAVDYLVDTLMESEEQITLVAVGPLTNIAMAMIKEPRIKDKIDKLIIMGGAIIEPGNITSAAEFNIYVDPEAAKVVFNSGVEIYLNTLDVTMKAVFLEKDINEMVESGNKISKIVGELLIFFAGTHVEHFGFLACPIHDALCIGQLIDPTLLSHKKVFCDVSLHDELTLGETVADLWNITGKEPNIYMATDVDVDKFKTMIKTHMEKPYISKQI